MSRSLPRCVALSSCALALASTAQNAPGSLPLDQVDLLSFEAVDLEAQTKEDDVRKATGQPFRFAVPRDVAITPRERGTWDTLATGELLWRLRVGAAEASSLNLGFGAYELPEGASLTLRAVDGSSSIRPFTSADNQNHGELWTPVLLTDELVVELVLQAHQLDLFELRLARVGQGYRGFGAHELAGSGGEDSGSCNVDVVCPEGDPWALEISSVAALTLNGSDLCTGVMLNDAQDSLTPNFLTADHCGVSSSSAGSLVAYWNYHNSFCRPPGSSASGSSGDGQLNQFNSGATHLASYGPSDFTLVRFNTDPDPAWDVSYAGWSRSSADPSMITAIHHPQVEEKRISFEFDPASTTSYLGDSVPGDGTHIKITDWDVGTTEPGSSGSPIFDPDHRVVGQLHGGYASCSSQTADWYGRLSVSWEGGGSPSSRLKDWLDPGASGAVFVDSISLNTLCSDTGTAEFLTAKVNCSGSASLRVVDCDLDLNSNQVELIQLTVTSTSEPAGESVTLVETSPGSARFEGSVALGLGGGANVLQVAGGDQLQLVYVDADDGLGGTNVPVVASVDVDCTPPIVTAVQILNIGPTFASVQISASEPFTGSVSYGPSCGNPAAVESTSGAASTTHNVQISGLADDTTVHFVINITDEAGNLTQDDNGGSCYSFTTLSALDYFTEEFNSDFDLNGQSVTFTPNGSPDGYAACSESISGLPVSPAGSSQVNLGDDDFESVNIGGGQSVSLYGVSYTTIYIGSNGYITFGEGDSDYTESLSEHFELPRVSGLYDDLDPGQGGLVGVLQTAQSMVITWYQVPQYGASDQNTFQIELYFDGRVRISWVGLASSDGIAGLSAGLGQQPDFIEDNLGSDYVCSPVVCETDFGFGGPGDALLEMCGDGLGSGQSSTLALSNAPASSPCVLVVSFSASPTPLLGGTLVPLPAVVTANFSTDPLGEFSFPSTPGGGGPATVYAQVVMVDPGQAQGFGFSNTVEAQFQP